MPTDCSTSIHMYQILSGRCFVVFLRRDGFLNAWSVLFLSVFIFALLQTLMSQPSHPFLTDTPLNTGHLWLGMNLHLLTVIAFSNALWFIFIQIWFLFSGMSTAKKRSLVFYFVSVPWVNSFSTCKKKKPHIY